MRRKPRSYIEKKADALIEPNEHWFCITPLDGKFHSYRFDVGQCIFSPYEAKKLAKRLLDWCKWTKSHYKKRKLDREE